MKPPSLSPRVRPDGLGSSRPGGWRLLQRVLPAFIAWCVLAILAAPARATDDDVAFVDEQAAKLKAADKISRQFVLKTTKQAARRDMSQAIDALGARGVAVQRDPKLRKLYEDKVIPQLIRCLGNDSEFGAAFPATDALEKFGAASVPPLLHALAHDTDYSVRGGVAKALGAIRPRAEATVPALIAALRDDRDYRVRIRVVEALGAIRPMDREAIPALIEALRDDPVRVRWSAARTLTDYALNFPEARAPLIQALADDSVHGAVTAYAEHSDNRLMLEKHFPEILRALEARHDADPVRHVARLLYHGFLALAVLSLLTCVYRMFFRQRKAFDRTRSGSSSYSASMDMDLSDLIEGLKVGDPKCVNYALSAGAFLSFGVSAILAIGFGTFFFGKSAVWLFLGCVIIFIVAGWIVQGTVISYQMRKTRKGTRSTRKKGRSLRVKGQKPC